MAQWLSWLERRPVTAEVEGSSPFWVVIWDLSSAGRASALQAEGHRFEPCRSHLYGEIAQLARAHGSYPWCRGFKSPSRYYNGNLRYYEVSFFCYGDEENGHRACTSGHLTTTNQSEISKAYLASVMVTRKMDTVLARVDI